ncbi:3-oxoacyl-ACP reductase FabG [Bradyrhizobium sp. AUGA SZCCT0240]|jgi:NAD(P)-dependent dehydrogenase (short-subunit alcohol dehydrogenase family)|uniref:3-oxoacyl-ACP reductase family protein n=1 Tax=unclassified Bradyrhizobium TaxID=2631580 RepID=UPI001BA559B8|nr:MULTISPECIES: 3-oxoacyl-ACP reductase family protein [unclassified Bradyrhizobium]MBR1187714.1 3-oxoacyl-ACP reductase FabG [Bradyrhizobium sp. AUGA SZCCT0160]MBR1194790.1 3-oxoacyl-ACP reductase FabG [Bradyrhizobium sp. AUGA SZCCT0158]MBR1239194.1 3-oxoacyl-ACP reductase FabG [Bradyrhizobium sp. AUGA SZCCT0274]MBR1254177.1 3-oxoacyl-ACP reductase FabG [Bradyrhizobium sp. AUGA SZCCT0240]
MSRLEGKRALVTGGSRGIGAAIALRLADEGADVALTYEKSRDRAEAVVAKIEARGRKGLAIAADSADPVAAKSAVDRAAAELGGLDILVNSAGIVRGYGPIETWTLEDIDRTLAVNVRGVILATQAAAAHLSKGGRVITIGSNLAERVPQPGITLYAASKSALLSFTRGLAHDLGPRGITVNLVHPGSTDTDMNPATGEGADFQRSRMPIPEYGKPQDIAGIVAWLASEEGRFANGAGFTVDGGANA